MKHVKEFGGVKLRDAGSRAIFGTLMPWAKEAKEAWHICDEQAEAAIPAILREVHRYLLIEADRCLDSRTAGHIKVLAGRVRDLDQGLE